MIAYSVPRDAASQKTIVVMAECTSPDHPGAEDVVYFEIPEAIDPITSLQTEVHTFLFDKLPPTPAQGLNELTSANRSLKCQTTGVEDDRGGLELRTDWQIGDPVKPVLRKAGDPFRPTAQHGMQQIRVTVSDEVPDSFEYLFDVDRATWLPSLDEDELVPSVAADHVSRKSSETALRELWYRVKDLVRVGEGVQIAPVASMALTDMSPESGNYILMSLRRRRRGTI